ncbi:hypothetical protein [Rheinheimera sp. 1928-s]|uniref:hypothetical protein n=1 Tax=Rheinheimera sp. 1928-s TaxID=3033803 RepID=UPI002612CF1B|nr:hypothetical protein [Rheinheimera sp. 1928-s]MDF3126496.1 hypothetical protein [Rheinheimera sp. 1928-s]
MSGNTLKYKIVSFIFLCLGAAALLDTLIEIDEANAFEFGFVVSIAGILAIISLGLAPEKLFLPLSKAFQINTTSKRHQVSDLFILSAGALGVIGFIGEAAFG